MSVLDKASPVPLYFQLQTILRQQLSDGLLQPSDQIDSEEELSRRYSVTRMTVRHAIDGLVQEGLLHRQKGRGTFVARPKLQQNMVNFAGVVEDLQAQRVRQSARLLSIVRTAAAEAVADRLGIPSGTAVYVVRRLRLADGEPVVLKTNYLPCDLFPGLEERDLVSRPFYEVFQQDYGLQVAGSWQEIEVALATREEAMALEVPPRSPVSIWHGRVFTPDRQVIEYIHSVYRGDKFRFFVEQLRRV